MIWFQSYGSFTGPGKLDFQVQTYISFLADYPNVRRGELTWGGSVINEATLSSFDMTSCINLQALLPDPAKGCSTNTILFFLLSHGLPKGASKKMLI